jgi:DNA repair exonuclease SbcCD ATPase subunit
MPTQEERLTALEQDFAKFQKEAAKQALEADTKITTMARSTSIVEYDLKQYKTETIKAYGEMAIEMIMIKGLTENAIGRIATLNDAMEKRFERVNIRIDAVNAHLDLLQQYADKTEKRLDTVEKQLTEHKTLLTEILARLPEKP